MKIKNNPGLEISFLDTGAIKNIENDQIRVNLRPGNLFSPSVANIYIRKKGSDHTFTPLTGSLSKSEFSVLEDAFYVKGVWEGLEYNAKLELSGESMSWRWSIWLLNDSGQICETDLILVQDVGLKAIQEGLVNEYYVSQYTERLLLKDPKHGVVVCCRQNMKEPSGHPWLLLASTGFASSGCTDGMQFYGNEYRSTGIPKALVADYLEGNLAGESSIVALQEQPFLLNQGESREVSFLGIFLADHPEATGINDLERIDKTLEEFIVFRPAAIGTINNWKKPVTNLINTAAFFPVDDLTPGELKTYFGIKTSYEEYREDKILSFFTDYGSHVVLKTKEKMVDRPHGHILQANTDLQPSEDIISVTCYASGIFNAHLSQGNTNFNVLLSIPASQFNLHTDAGQRIIVEFDDQHYLLGIPSAYEMGLNYCRWIYKSGTHLFEVRTWTSVDKPRVYTDFKILKGEPISLYLSHQLDQTNNWHIEKTEAGDIFRFRPVRGMMNEKFPESQFRLKFMDPAPGQCPDVSFTVTGEPETSYINGHFLIVKMKEIRSFYLSFSGDLSGKPIEFEPFEPDEQFHSDRASADAFWNSLSLGLSLKGQDQDVQAISQILPWYGNNALVHFLTPYGLEQFSGAAWGTRDVAQGPIELLLHTQKYDEARNVLLKVFSHQNAFGDWPQWWMFDAYKTIRAADCHGDIYYWVLIALANFIKTTGDISILEEKVPYFDDDQHVYTISEHVDRLIQMITDSYLEGTSFVPFGGGDWNDSLQPVSRELSQKLISSWTVEMNYQAFNVYSEVFERTGDTAKALKLRDICAQIKQDLNQYLIKDCVIAGYGYMESPGNISLLLHPSDTKTGIRYSLLPMNRGIISGIFTNEQAHHHQKIINRWLKGPDGARLMDRPLKYKGGIQEIFQRAESSTFFGREIGLMYIHEHIRYAESQALLGNADEFVLALRQAIPIDYPKIVDCGDLRQSNCYYSSSDVSFTTRFEADEKYAEILQGKQMVKGGWRVYSSGPGIFISLVISKLLGIRLESERLILDPVLPKKMDGLWAGIRIKSREVKIHYEVRKDSYSPKKITLNGEILSFTIEFNPYRLGGAVIDLNLFESKLNPDNNLLVIEM